MSDDSGYSKWEQNIAIAGDNPIEFKIGYQVFSTLEEVTGFYHIACGSPAYSPSTNKKLWFCLNCNTYTYHKTHFYQAVNDYL